jgi:hypothetical protein
MLMSAFYPKRTLASVCFRPIRDIGSLGLLSTHRGRCGQSVASMSNKEALDLQLKSTLVFSRHRV